MPERDITWVECPRDAWQGLSESIPADLKRRHLVHLFDAGFRFVDLGSFVSPRAVPQLADTEEVLEELDAPPGADVSCIVANVRGVERAAAARGVTSVGYPLGVSDTFQRRNVGRSLDESWDELRAVASAAEARGLDLVVYLSMGFGNPYGEAWSAADTAAAWERVRSLGVHRVAIADTVGTADADTVDAVLAALGGAAATAGVHLHARPDAWRPLVDAALRHGVRWFEGALAGVGGCPFAGDALVGNLPTERVLPYLHARGFRTPVVEEALPELANEAAGLAARYA